MSTHLTPLYFIAFEESAAQHLKTWLRGSPFQVSDDADPKPAANRSGGIMIVDCTSDSIEALEGLILPDSPSSPDIVILALVNREDSTTALKAGASDVLIKEDLNPALLRRSLRLLERQWTLMQELREARRKEKAANTQFHNIINSNADSILVVDRDGIILLVNPTAETLFKRDANSLVGESFGFPVNAAHITEIEILQPSGDPAILEMKTAEIEWNGQSAYLLSLRDITRHKKQQSILQEEIEYNQQFTSAIASLSSGVVLTDVSESDNPIIFANEGFTKLTGYSVEEIVGKNCRFLQGAATDPAQAKTLREAIRDARSVTVTILNYRKDGTPFWNELTISPIFDNGKLVNFVGLQSDVTLQKQAEAALIEQEKLRLALEKEYELGQARSRFMTSISHEFRTPLSIITNSLYLLSRSSDEARRTDQQQKIANQVQRLTNLTEDVGLMLELDYTQVMSISAVDLHGVLTAVEADLKPLYEHKQHHVKFELHPVPVMIVGDVMWLQKAISRILANAHLYTPTGGYIVIRTLVQRDMTLVEIRDTGIGMSREIRERAFERFYRGDENHSTPGFGLGLTIAKMIIERHRGHISVESREGHGSTFRISFPLSPGSEQLPL
ncbi:MAG: PAS domain-containing protein [Anaerolineae bacterium]|nr:PAS domain-containing protein [Anaerolineae bacterium]